MNWFKNLKIRMKMLVSFGLIIALMAGLSVYAVAKLKETDDGFCYVIDYPIEEEMLLRDFRSDLRELRRCSSAIVMFITANDIDRINGSAQAGTAAYHECIQILDSIDALVSSSPRASDAVKSNILANTAELRRNMVIYKSDVFDPVVAAALSGDYDGAMKYFLGAANIIAALSSGSDALIATVEAIADSATSDTKARADFAVLLIIAVSVASVLIALVSALYVAGLVSKPLIVISGFFTKAGTTGDITVSADEMKVVNSLSQQKDEIGQLSNDAVSFIGHVTESAKELEIIAGGDLSASIKTLSDKDTLGISLKKMIDNLNDLFGAVNASAAQVYVGSKQVADTATSIAASATQMAGGAQSLAEGSMRQAASVEEVSSSIAKIAEKTKANSAMTGQAANLAETIINKAEKGSRQMAEMITAVNDIKEASNSIRGIIETIDSIAEQTNLLSLNAAIEAARAGEQGRGFAVVAEEVRKLATQSAEAVQETSSVIQDSMQKAELGARVAGEMAASLTEIVAGINESSRLIMEISKASEEQSISISQINTSIEHVAEIVQNNREVAEENAAAAQESAAAAEESAAAADEMSAQSNIMEGLISQFKLKDR